MIFLIASMSERYFTIPRLASERQRVSCQVFSGELVLVPFCGVGPFVIPAAVHGATVVAVEQNPEACRWLRENVVLNGVEDQVILIIGDAFDTSHLPAGAFDRAIIPTPYGMDAIFDLIAPLVKPGGMIHFYTFCTKDQADARCEEFVRSGFDCIVQRRCGNVAPGISRWVYDLRKRVISRFPVRNITIAAIATTHNPVVPTATGTMGLPSSCSVVADWQRGLRYDRNVRGRRRIFRNSRPHREHVSR